MNILAVDATGDSLSLALDARGRVFRSRRASAKQDEALLPAAEALLKKARISWRDLDAVAAARGPGRFTGIRVAMAFAAAAGFELGVPALAISRLEAAADASGLDSVVAALPGWKDEVYHQEFRRAKTGPREASRPGWSSAEAWPADRAAFERRGLAVFARDPDAADLLPAARRLVRAGKTPPFTPFYLKPAGYQKPAPGR